jgi:hypothetical protein|tara:strand:+ start:683 stop:898 length:216 start_codon:yes stop_codon:yes gene_type:complete
MKYELNSIERAFIILSLITYKYSMKKDLQTKARYLTDGNGNIMTTAQKRLEINIRDVDVLIAKLSNEIGVK